MGRRKQSIANVHPFGKLHLTRSGEGKIRVSGGFDKNGEESRRKGIKRGGESGITAMVRLIV